MNGKISTGMDRAGWGSHDHPFEYAGKKSEENRWAFLYLEKNQTGGGLALRKSVEGASN